MFGVLFGFLKLFRTVKRTSRNYSHTQWKEAPFSGAYVKPAQSEAFLRGQIPLLPEADVLNIIDGDTIIVSKNPRNEMMVRLDSIDCPENGQSWGDISKYGLIKLIGGKVVRIEEHGIDPYRRTLATIYIWDNKKNDWININERMVTLGHAWVMRQFYNHLPPDRKSKLDSLERWAKSKKVGLWKEANPIPPWEHRKK